MSDFAARASVPHFFREACAHVNDNFDVADLNRELPGRVQQLLELKGDKLRK